MLQGRIHPTLQIESTWRLKVSRQRTCEHPRWLDSPTRILADEESKPVSRPCSASPQFTSIPLIWLTYRNYTARWSKPGVYTEVVCRECGKSIAEDWQPHLDTSTMPVCPLFPQYIHSLVDVRVQRCFSNFPDPRWGTDETQPFILGKAPRGGRSHWPSRTFQ